MLFGGRDTHDAALKLVGQLVAHTDHDAHIIEIVKAALPKDYSGDTLDEIEGMIRSARKKGFDEPSHPQAEGGAPFSSDEHLAQVYAHKHGDEMRYVAKWSRWMVWDGARWHEDDKRLAFQRARAICKTVAAQMNNLKAAKTVASAKTRAAVVSMAQDDPTLVASIDQWDADPMLLNTPTCVVDLRTGERRPHRPADYMTKMCAVGPDPNCPTLIFDAFLDKITASDEELIRYFQRRYGYALTGLTREHALFFDYGTGGNGKGVLMSTVAGILGDYHRVVPMDMLMLSFGDRHPTELAGLVGARMASADETKSGGNWDEAKIKALTGGTAGDGAAHAARLLRLHAAVQAVHQRQQQARAA